MEENIKGQNIRALEFPETVRLNPGMYVGDIDEASLILREIVDNSIDEVLSGSASKVFIHTKGSYYLVADDGRGIPIWMDEAKGITKTELAMSSLHAGGKFDGDTISVGMHGVGASCTNALSNEFIVLSRVTDKNFNRSIPKVQEVYESRNHSLELYYCIVFNRGVKAYEGCKTLDEIMTELKIDYIPGGYSTYTLFIPDETIFTHPVCKQPKRNLLNTKYIASKFYDKDIHFIINDEDLDEELAPYKYEMIGELTPTNPAVNKKVGWYLTFEFDNDLSVKESSGSVNSLVTNAGYHIGLSKDIISNALRRHYPINHAFVTEGLKFFVIALASKVKYDSQTKTRLLPIEGMEYRDIHQLDPLIDKVFKENKAEIDIHVERLNEYAASVTQIAAIDKLRSLVNMNTEDNTRSRSFIPKQVFDASSPDRSLCELFIVEGKSAGNGLVAARPNGLYHAILPLRGRPMNTIFKDWEQLIENQEMHDLIATIGMGINQTHQAGVDAKPRYGKIIIAADADSDGAAIAALTLGAIGYHMTFLIDMEMVYIADSPLYFQGGKYIYEHNKDELDPTKPSTRFKGLGELNPDQLRDTLIDPSKRRLLKVTRDGFDDAMGLLTSSNRRRQLMVSKGILTNPHHIYE